MAKITVHAGDFKKGGGNSISFGDLFLETPEGQLKMILPDEIECVEVASEQSVKRMGGALALGAIGGLALGPVGLLAGALAGGNRKDVTFILELKDGRRLLGTVDGKAFVKLQAMTFA